MVRLKRQAQRSEAINWYRSIDSSMPRVWSVFFIISLFNYHIFTDRMAHLLKLTTQVSPEFFLNCVLILDVPSPPFPFPSLQLNVLDL